MNWPLLVILLIWAIFATAAALILWRNGRRKDAVAREVTAASRAIAESPGQTQPHFTNIGGYAGEMTSAFRQMAKRFNEELTEENAAQQRLSSILDTMTDGIVIVDGGGSVTLVNPAAKRMLGISPDAGAGKRLLQVV